ncbi:hypothetical protein ACQR1Y_24520 [Bradyrhizobium sp. HKCCYLRH3099]|uniref:hypothetical protein n=1 Tax=unclassified Bradyrhizobium TaxID=2631580 RepID=UPI003EBA422C
MSNALPFMSPAEKLRNDVRGLSILALLVVGMAVWVTLAGHTDRVVYRGSGGGWGQDMVVLKTDQPGVYLIERSSDHRDMKVGCTYDLSYDHEFGQYRRNRIKTVRRATLVGC